MSEKYDQLTAVSINGNENYKLTQLANGRSWDGLSHINFLIGPTSSGKSRFLRGVYSNGAFQFQSRYSNSQAFAQVFIGLKASLDSFLPDNVIGWSGYKRSEISQWTHPPELFSSDGDNSISNIASRLERVAMMPGSLSIESSGYTAHLDGHLLNSIKRLSEEAAKSLRKLSSSLGLERRVYIPVLRGLRPLNTQQDVKDRFGYEVRTRSDYFKSDSGNIDRHIFTGESVYTDLTKRLLGYSSERAQVAEYQQFLSTHLFDGKTVEIIPHGAADTVFVKIGDEKDLAIFDVGDGIQSLIILTYDAFFNDKRTLYFIEEPDLFLHPGLQRKFIELLSFHPKFAKHQFFLTTHSNHFLDLTVDYSDISVFKFSPKSQITEVQKVSSFDRTILHEIGARSSSVFLTNVAIWVEGITDRLYLRAFLENQSKGGRKLLREDTAYSILELGGTNLVHWDFSHIGDEFIENIKALRICAESFVLIDGDNAKKADRKEQLEAALGANFHIWAEKEIENYLPESVVREAARILISRATRFTKAEKENAIAKLADISANEYLKTPLGRYLDDRLSLDYFSSKSGTMTSEMKVKFCRLVCELIRNSKEKLILNSEVNEVCAKIFDFIAKHNS